jgi:hypothetical protein
MDFNVGTPHERQTVISKAIKNPTIADVELKVFRKENEVGYVSRYAGSLCQRRDLRPVILVLV